MAAEKISFLSPEQWAEEAVRKNGWKVALEIAQKLTSQGWYYTAALNWIRNRIPEGEK
jgi:hypothetical protein